MRLNITNARIVTFDQIVAGVLNIDDGRIAGINLPDFEADRSIDAGGCYVAPGFVDIHTHGGFGHDYMDCTEEAYIEVPRKILEYGATSVVPTLLSADPAELLESIRVYETAKKKPPEEPTSSDSILRDRISPPIRQEPRTRNTLRTLTGKNISTSLK